MQVDTFCNITFPGIGSNRSVNVNLDNSVAISLSEPSSFFDNSFSSVKSQSTICESPDGSNSFADDDPASKLL